MSLFRATSAQADDRNPDDRNPSDRNPDRLPDDVAAGEPTPDPRYVDQRFLDPRYVDDRNADERNANDRTGNDRTGNDRTGNDRTANDRTGNDWTTGDRHTNDRNAYDRATGGLDPNGRNADPMARTGDPNAYPNARNAAREPYRINRVPDEPPADDPIPDGPTQRIDKRTIRRGRRRGNLFVLVVAMVALNVAGVAGLLAWRAFGLAKTVAGGQAKATATATTAPGAGAPVPATSGATTAPAAGGSYAVAYAQEPLRVQVGCSAVMFLDLDEPRANAGENVSDLRYDSRCGAQPPDLTLGPGATAGAQVTPGDIDAAGCSAAIQTSPLGPGASVLVKKGVALCVLTGATPPDMVLVEVTDVGQTGMAGMRATSWKVTG